MRLQHFTDTNFGILDSTKNKHAVAYDAPSNKYVLVRAFTVLEEDIEEQSQTFLDVVQEELNQADIDPGFIDGGFF